MGAHFSFSTLGALEVRVGDQRVPIGSPRQRNVLAMLLLAADRVVSIDSLIESVWNGQPPATGRTQVAICIAALRKQFKAAGCDDEVIVTMPPGYLLRSTGHRIDAVEFTAHVAAAQAAVRQGRGAEAVDLFGAALDLWHGPALAGINGYLIEAEAALLEEQRLTAYETRTALRLELGQCGVLISELAAMTQEYPLREQLRAQLMLAQYRAGRRAEALTTFRVGRQHSVDEVGIEPGPALRNLHDAILRDDPSLIPSPRPEAQVGSTPAPSQLTPDLSDFIGRDAELSTLDQLLAISDGGRAPAVGVVTGPAGVGKSRLVVRWAHRVSERFPDGQLFADLRGYHAAGEPSDPADVLGHFLRALGIPGERIPADLHERATLYRSTLDRKRVLVILDNVSTVGQVVPLLPGNGGCCVVVTSRSVLCEPLAGHGAPRTRLGVMSEREANALLRLVIGDARVAADPVGVARLGELCGWLPLALRISAARLAAKPHWTVRHLVNRLEDQRRRLDELEADGDHLRRRFEPSYRRLDADGARMYRRLGLLDTPDFAAWTGAALLNTNIKEAERLMEQLVEAQLLDVGPGGPTVRYRFHELLRLHAHERAVAEESAAERAAAGERLLRGWLVLAAEARRRESGTSATMTGPPRRGWTFDQDYVDELLREPGAWLVRERMSIKAATEQVTRCPSAVSRTGGIGAATALFAELEQGLLDSALS
ncbi:MAG TPA: BTAD domain-containing putative transcriptional regulator [Pseudonocardiaceae bacterium]|nr:BTAD domain-containing putative transcriptional regulator [Pseudonocardiaceae bacterium]